MAEKKPKLLDPDVVFQTVKRKSAVLKLRVKSRNNIRLKNIEDNTTRTDGNMTVIGKGILGTQRLVKDSNDETLREVKSVGDGIEKVDTRTEQMQSTLDTMAAMQKDSLKSKNDLVVVLKDVVWSK
jgi:hypothetical protein